MKKFLAAVLFGSFVTSGAASAAAPQLIGEYDDWAAYSVKDGKGTICYMASTPKKDEGKYTKRGDIYVIITHRPAEKSYDVVNFSWPAIHIKTVRRWWLKSAKIVSPACLLTATKPGQLMIKPIKNWWLQ